MKQSKKYSKAGKHSVSDKVIEEADKIANGIKKPGQSKEQTKLISQGIQKGIEIYKKQQKSKARDLNKQLKKAKNGSEKDLNQEDSTKEKLEQGSNTQVLSWSLLVCSWIGFITYFIYFS